MVTSTQKHAHKKEWFNAGCAGAKQKRYSMDKNSIKSKRIQKIIR